MKSITVKVPATTANLGAGFDTLALALDLYNYVTIELDTKTHIEVENEGRDSLPLDEKNIVYIAAKAVFDMAEVKMDGLKIKLVNNIPLARGLGSSAAARVGGAMGANYLLGNRFSKDEIMSLTADLEGHPDNVTPALFGGLTISYVDKEELKYFKISPSVELKIVVVIPQFEVSTSRAREILPSEVSREDAVFNISRACLLVSSLLTGQLEHIGAGMQDMLHQSYRKKLVPGIDDVFEDAMKSGARGVALSGAGPSITAFTTEGFEKIGNSMQQAFLKHNIKSRFLVTEVNNNGTEIIE
ncbi:homoserine kinase [bacterium]|nr:homoserine kinase [bacterium]